MLISSDQILKWIADISDEKNRLIIRSARGRRSDEALMGCGGLDALSELDARLNCYMARENAAQAREADLRAKREQRKRLREMQHGTQDERKLA